MAKRGTAYRCTLGRGALAALSLSGRDFWPGHGRSGSWIQVAVTRRYKSTTATVHELVVMRATILPNHFVWGRIAIMADVVTNFSFVVLSSGLPVCLI